MIALKILFRSNEEFVIASENSNSLECGRERSFGISAFRRLREGMIIDEYSHLLDSGKRRSSWKFEFVRMRDGEIAEEIQIRSNAGGSDRAQDLN